MVPSDRVIVPRSLALAPPDAVTVPLATTGGHAPAHAPEQTDLFMGSFTHRYSARPDELVRNEPAEPEAVVITVPVVDVLPEADVAPEAAAPAAEPLLLHAATSSAAASGTPSLTGIGSRASNELLIFIVSLSGGDGLVPGRPEAVTYRRDYGAGREKGLERWM